MMAPIIHHPFNFALGPIKLTGFGIAMMAAFGRKRPTSGLTAAAPDVKLAR